MPKLSRRQIGKASAVVEWYLNRYYGTEADIGMPAMFMRPEMVGGFAVTEDEWNRGDSDALFRLLIATTLFQKRQDQQVLRILQGMRLERVRDLTSVASLIENALRGPCDRIRSQEQLLATCDLSKDESGRAYCTANPTLPCTLKHHSEWLKRYGHFGRVPTSAALSIVESGATDLSHLYESVCASTGDSFARAKRLQDVLCGTWRVSEKIAGMYLSMLTNPDLSANPPWKGIDWSYYVVVDSNTDLFLAELGYAGPRTYSGRREFIWALSDAINLTRYRAGLQARNPRLVQQAAYLFMGRTNRRALSRDCSHEQGACDCCPRILKTSCPVKAVRNPIGDRPRDLPHRETEADTAAAITLTAARSLD